MCTEHLLLGLIAEDSSSPKGGYFGFSSLTMDRVRAAITERASNAGRKVSGWRGGRGRETLNKTTSCARVSDGRRPVARPSAACSAQNAPPLAEANSGRALGVVDGGQEGGAVERGRAPWRARKPKQPHAKTRREAARVSGNHPHTNQPTTHTHHHQDVSKPTELPFSSAAKRAFEGALAESRSLGVNYISPEHVLAALLAPGAGGRARALAGALGVDADALKAKAVTKLRGEADGGGGASRQRAAAGGRAGGGDTKSVLAELTRDMCEEARCGRTDPVIGRDGEVCRAVQILARRTKSNPILIGEPGVGKTAIAEGLAAAIVTGVLPDGSPLPSFLEVRRGRRERG